MVLQSPDLNLTVITVSVPTLIADIAVVNAGNKKARPNKGWARRLAEKPMCITALRYFFGQVLSGCSRLQIRHKNFFINKMNRPQLKMSGDFTFDNKFVNSLLTDPDNRGYFFDRQVSGRFHYNLSLIHI